MFYHNEGEKKSFIKGLWVGVIVFGLLAVLGAL